MGLPLLEHVGCAVPELPRTDMSADTVHSTVVEEAWKSNVTGTGISRSVGPTAFSFAFVFAPTMYVHVGYTQRVGSHKRIAQTQRHMNDAIPNPGTGDIEWGLRGGGSGQPKEPGTRGYLTPKMTVFGYLIAVVY